MRLRIVVKTCQSSGVALFFFGEPFQYNRFVSEEDCFGLECGLLPQFLLRFQSPEAQRGEHCSICQHFFQTSAGFSRFPRIAELVGKARA